MTATMQDVNGQTLTKRPPVQCQPWCSEGDGHPDEWYTDDQQCRTAERSVDLSGLPKMKVSGGDRITSEVIVTLVAPRGDPMHVEVSLDNIHGHSGWLEMTLTEAHDLANHLLVLNAQAERKL